MNPLAYEVLVMELYSRGNNLLLPALMSDALKTKANMKMSCNEYGIDGLLMPETENQLESM